MKRKIFVLIITFIIYPAVFCFSASAHQTLYEEAQTAYQKGDFEAALQKFLTLRQSGFTAPAVDYNIGNCYYKLGQTGKAILFYERARDIEKRDADLKLNLRISKKQMQDHWKENSGPFLETLTNPMTENLNIQELTFFEVILIWIMLLLLSIRILGTKKNQIIHSFIILFIPFILLCSICLLISVGEKNSRRAVLIEKSVSVRSGPENSFPITLTLHEGTTVKILEENAEWAKAEFPDKTIGWLESKTFEFI